MFKDIRKFPVVPSKNHLLIFELSTLKVFRDGEPIDYTGPRKADGIISYMIK